MANTITYAQVFQQQLDQQAVQTLVTGWMDGNAGQVKYNGGKEVKIPKLSMDGLANYDRNGGGYQKGALKFEYETRTMGQDRGRKFELDANDVDETNFTMTAGLVMGEFQRTKVVPEIDAYRIAALAQTAMKVDTQCKYSYTADKKDIVEEVKKGISYVRDKGYNGTLMIHMSYDAKLALELALVNNLSSITYSVGGIDTTVPAIDKCPIIETPSSRMYSKIDLQDGKTSGQEAGGYIKDAKGIDINFLIIPADTPIAVTKQDNMRIFDPQTYQEANSWSMDYRRYHELWVKDNREGSIYANFKGAKPTP